jgi:hypothetical protein
MACLSVIWKPQDWGGSLGLIGLLSHKDCVVAEGAGGSLYTLPAAVTYVLRVYIPFIPVHMSGHFMHTNFILIIV